MMATMMRTTTTTIKARARVKGKRGELRNRRLEEVGRWWGGDEREREGRKEGYNITARGRGGETMRRRVAAVVVVVVVVVVMVALSGGRVGGMRG